MRVYLKYLRKKEMQNMKYHDVQPQVLFSTMTQSSAFTRQKNCHAE